MYAHNEKKTLEKVQKPIGKIHSSQKNDLVKVMIASHSMPTLRKASRDSESNSLTNERNVGEHKPTGHASANAKVANGRQTRTAQQVESGRVGGTKLSAVTLQSKKQMRVLRANFFEDLLKQKGELL